MNTPASAYALKIQSERFFKTTRYHWMICGASDSDEIVSWGYASSRIEAEAAAQNEIRDLCAGLTKGGKVESKKTWTRRSMF